jgi:hypothetical protein|tara:strand:- start:290 stop:505 length:216 start_codon:yes stop_codon:yes gene_type:complete
MKTRYQVELKDESIYSKSFSTPQKAIKEVGSCNIKSLKTFLVPDEDKSTDGIKNKSGKQFLGRKQSNRINR